MIFPVALLAGGQATRLYPLTQDQPKSLLEVQGKPFILHQIEYLRSQRVTDLVICTGAFHARIETVVGDGHRWEMNIRYSQDTPAALGTGGAIKKAWPLLDEHCFVMYGDSYLQCRLHVLQDAFIASGKKALMAIFKNKNQWDKSNVHFDGKNILAYDKKNMTPEMQYIDYGISLFHRSAFDTVPADVFYDLAQVHQTLLQENNLAAIEVKKRFYEIGSFAGLTETRRNLHAIHDTIFE